MLSVQIDPRPGPRGLSWRFRRKPVVLAVFSFRYDAHLVPDLVSNIAPMVDGWVSWDDRDSSAVVSNDRDLRFQLLDAAHAAGATWILRVDPDERFESALSERMNELVAGTRPVVWSFDLREMYSPSSYRIDGIWGRKTQGRLFPISDGLFPAATSGRFPSADFHGPSFPIGFRMRPTGLNLYHLKMIAPARRRKRRDLYAALDPSCEFQPIGYDYLADETGAVFETIPAGRDYAPRHVDDGGLWMADELPGRVR